MSTSGDNIAGKGISLLLRVPADGIPIEQIAEAHCSVINDHGCVWLGVVGKSYSAKNVHQISQNGDFLYVVQKTTPGICTYKGKIVDFSKSVPAVQRSLIPRYYHDAGIADRATLWVKLSSLKRIGSQEIEELRVISSGKSASALLSGMAYFAMVERK